MKVTIDLDPDLYRAIKVEAARGDSSVRQVVEAALGAWLERLEDDEDRAAAAEALEEYRRDGGEAAASFLTSLAADVRATYAPDEG